MKKYIYLCLLLLCAALGYSQSLPNDQNIQRTRFKATNALITDLWFIWRGDTIDFTDLIQPGSIIHNYIEANNTLKSGNILVIKDDTIQWTGSPSNGQVLIKQDGVWTNYAYNDSTVIRNLAKNVVIDSFTILTPTDTSYLATKWWVQSLPTDSAAIVRIVGNTSKFLEVGDSTIYATQHDIKNFATAAQSFYNIDTVSTRRITVNYPFTMTNPNYWYEISSWYTINNGTRRIDNGIDSLVLTPTYFSCVVNQPTGFIKYQISDTVQLCTIEGGYIENDPIYTVDSLGIKTFIRTIRDTIESHVYDVLKIDTSYNITGTEPVGAVFWDKEHLTTSLKLPDGGLIQNGQEIFDYYTNLSGVTLVEGDIVSVVGATGNRTAVELCDATDSTSALNVIGMVTVPSALNNEMVRVTKLGKVHELTTNTYTEGSRIFVNPANPGKWTGTMPSAGNYCVCIGVVDVSHSVNGVVDLSLKTIPKLSDLSDVNGTPLDSTGQFPVWNNTSKYFDFNYNINNYATTIQNAAKQDTTNAVIRTSAFTTDTSIVVVDGVGRKIKQSLSSVNRFGDINIPTGRTYKINNIPLLNSSLLSGSIGAAGTIPVSAGSTSNFNWATVYSVIATTPTTNKLVKFGATKLENSIISESGTVATVVGSLKTINGNISIEGNVVDPTGTQSILSLPSTLISSNTTQQQIISAQSYFQPTGASLSAIYGLLFLPSLKSSATNISEVNGIYNRLDIYNTYSGAINLYNGIKIDEPFIQATPSATISNIRAIVSSIASGAGRYNLYINGTADNYIAANTGIGTTNLTGTPTIGRLTVKGSTSDNTANAQVWRNSGEVNIASLNNAGLFTSTSASIGGATHKTTIATDGTVVLNGDATAWEDLNFAPNESGGPPTTVPDFVTINNVIHREFTSANNQLCGDNHELPHRYKLSSTLTPHCHIFLKSGESAGTTGVTFTFYWELRQTTGTTSGSVTLTASSAQLANGNKVDIANTAFAGAAELGANLSVTIARTGGDAGDVILMTYGVHYEVDSFGSSQITTK